MAAREAGQPSEAEEICRESLKLDPENTSAHSLLAMLMEERYDFEGALAQLSEVVRLNPDSQADAAWMRRVRRRVAPGMTMRALRPLEWALLAALATFCIALFAAEGVSRRRSEAAYVRDAARSGASTETLPNTSYREANASPAESGNGSPAARVFPAGGAAPPPVSSESPIPVMAPARVPNQPTMPESWQAPNSNSSIPVPPLPPASGSGGTPRPLNSNPFGIIHFSPDLSPGRNAPASPRPSTPAPAVPPASTLPPPAPRSTSAPVPEFITLPTISAPPTPAPAPNRSEAAPAPSGPGFRQALSQAQSDYSQGDYRQALDAYRQALAGAPTTIDQARVRQQMGMTYGGMGAPREAEEEYSLAESLYATLLSSPQSDVARQAMRTIQKQRQLLEGQ